MPIKFLNSGLLEGSLQLTSYGGGSISGTGTYNLGVDASGNVIETSLIEGSGTTNYVVKWTPDGNTLGDSQIFDNGTNVGIGTTSPGSILTVRNSGSGNSPFKIEDSGGVVLMNVNEDASGNAEVRLNNSSGTQTVRLDTSGSSYFNGGNLGIGTNLPGKNLHVYDSSGGATLKIESNTSNAYDSSKIELIGGNLSTGEIIFGDPIDSDVGKIIYRHDGNSLAFNVNASERMRIDSSGDVTIQASGADDIKNFTINSTNGSSQIAGFVIQNDGANGYVHFKAGAGGASPTTKLTIGNAANTGNVGIGVTSPATGSHKLAIESASTVGSVDSHIALIGDSATNGQGPQILFSESGDGQAYAGGTIGFVRTGSNSQGDLVFGTRGSAGDATTTTTERMRIDSNGQVQLPATGDGTYFTLKSSHTNNNNIIEIGQVGSDGFLDVSAADGSVVTHLSGYTGYESYFLSNVAIGTTSTSSELSVSGGTPQIDLVNSTSTDVWANIRAEAGAGTGGTLVFQTKRNGNTPTDKLVISDEGSTTIYNDFNIDNGSPEIYFQTGSTHYRWMVAAQENIDAALEITPSTTTGGSTYSTPVAVFKATGNVGIGESSPVSNLHIKDSTSSTDVRIQDSTGNTTLYLQSQNGIGVFGTITNNDLRFDTNDTERMRIDSSGNVGINESSPSAISTSATTLHIKGSVSSKAGAIRLRSSDNSVDAYIYPDSTNGMTLGTLSNHNFRVNTNSTERMRITSGGDVGIGTSSPSQKLDVVGSIEVSDGIYLGGTASANKLDDYEEGTWTPTIFGFTGGMSGTSYSTQVGTYTKIGNSVRAFFSLTFTSTITAGYTLLISSLPFTPDGTYTSDFLLSVGYKNNVDFTYSAGLGRVSLSVIGARKFLGNDLTISCDDGNSIDNLTTDALKGSSSVSMTLMGAISYKTTL